MTLQNVHFEQFGRKSSLGHLLFELNYLIPNQDFKRTCFSIEHLRLMQPTFIGRDDVAVTDCSLLDCLKNSESLQRVDVLSACSKAY